MPSRNTWQRCSRSTWRRCTSTPNDATRSAGAYVVTNAGERAEATAGCGATGVRCQPAGVNCARYSTSTF